MPSATASTVRRARGLVSGRFHGYGEKPMAPYTQPLRLDLRVDVSKVDGYEDRRVLNIISGDMFLHNQYLVTFKLRVPNPENLPGVIHGDAELIVRDKGGKRVTDTIAVEYNYDKEICTVGGVKYFMTFASPHFRFLNIELDHSTDLQDSAAIVKESEKILKKYFTKAGYDCRVNDYLAEPNPISFSPTGGWSTQELNEVQKKYFKSHGSDIEWPKWSMYGLLVSRFEEPNVLGIIYDTEDKTQRQGFAAFVEEIRRILGDPLKQGTEAHQIFEHTLIHEAGHVLNLSHSFERLKNRPYALSWMNYPQEYRDSKIGRQGNRDFWEQFKNIKDFDEEELEVIRHGPLNFIIPGGLEWTGFGEALTADKHSLPKDDMPFMGCSDGEKGVKRKEHTLTLEDAHGIARDC